MDRQRLDRQKDLLRERAARSREQVAPAARRTRARLSDSSRTAREWLAEAARDASNWLAEAADATRSLLAAGIDRLYRWRGRLRGRGVEAPDDASAVVAFPEDDAVDVIELLDASNEPDITLLVPASARRLREPLAWPHIASHVRRRGLRVRVVAKRRDVRRYAREAGLPVSRRLSSQRRGIRIGNRLFPLPDVELWPLVRFAAVVGLLAVAVGAAWYTVPEAEVVLVPVSTPVEAVAEVRVNPLADTPNAAANVLPGRTAEVTVTTIASTTTSGIAEVGDAPSTVELTFTNESEQDITLPAGFAVTDANGWEVTLDEGVTVPAGATATAAATSAEPGAGGNVVAGALDTLPADAPAGLSVTNRAPASGGTNREVAAVAAEDVERVRTIADAVLRRAGERELAEIVPEDGVFFPETLSVTILSEEPLAEVGDVGDVFLMEYEAVVSALIVPPEALQAYAHDLLGGDLGADEVLVPGSATAEINGPPRMLENGAVFVSVSAVGQRARAIDQAALRSSLAGISPGAASERIAEQIQLREPPHIDLSPGWWPDWWLPRRDSQITISFAPELPSADEPAGDGDEDAAPGSADEALPTVDEAIDDGFTEEPSS